MGFQEQGLKLDEEELNVICRNYAGQPKALKRS
jgi:hypothetical protein